MVRAQKPRFGLGMEEIVAEIELRQFRDARVDIEGEAAEDDDALEVFEEFDFAFEEGLASTDFGGVGFVVGRSAADRSGDPGVTQGETVVAMGGGGLVGEAGFVESAEEKIAGAVAGEDAAGAVGTVGTGGKAENEEAGGGVAEAGDGAAPVGFRLIGAALDDGDVGAVFAKSRALVTGDDGGGEGTEGHRY